MLTLKSNSIIKIPQREKFKKSELEKQENKTKQTYSLYHSEFISGSKHTTRTI